jgi:hypothetical protein
MLTPTIHDGLLDKKGFCEDILTKQAHFGQETLTALGKETLTNQERVLWLLYPRKLRIFNETKKK